MCVSASVSECRSPPRRDCPSPFPSAAPAGPACQGPRFKTRATTFVPARSMFVPARCKFCASASYTTSLDLLEQQPGLPLSISLSSTRRSACQGPLFNNVRCKFCTGAIYIVILRASICSSKSRSCPFPFPSAASADPHGKALKVTFLTMFATSFVPAHLILVPARYKFCTSANYMIIF